MGCGGSRADAIEPRYYESWTRETESTWLTNTDSESPPPGDGAAEPAPRPGPGPGPGPGPDILEDGKSTQTGVTTTSTTPGILNTEKKPSSGPQCANPTVPTSGAAAQRPNSFRTAEMSVLKKDKDPVLSSLQSNVLSGSKLKESSGHLHSRGPF